MTTGESSAAPQVLRRQLGRKPVLWVGAGLSRQADPPLPTLWQLAKGLADAPIGWKPLPVLDDPYALFDRCLDEGIAQPGELHDYLESRLRPDGRDPKPGALHRHLAALAYAGTFPFIVDPNYDLLLRRAMQDLRAPHTHSTLEQNLARPSAGTWYLSIHGDLNDWSEVVLTRASYRRFDERYRFLRAQFDLLLLKHPVLFVGCSLTDPRLLDWAAGLDESARANIKTWVALVGPGEKARLAATPYEGPGERRAAGPSPLVLPGERGREGTGASGAKDGGRRSTLDVIGRQLQVLELPSFEALPDWFEELARPARRAIEGEGRALTVTIEAGDERWRVEAEGQVNEVPPPDLSDTGGSAGAGDALHRWRDLLPPEPMAGSDPAAGVPRGLGAALLLLRSLAGLGLDADEAGRIINPSDATIYRTMELVSRSIGRTLTALLPPAGQNALARLAGSSAVRGDALVRIRVRGPQGNAALTLPWELLLVDDRFPVSYGELDVAREAVAEGVTEGLPSPPRPFSAVAHVAAPQLDGMPELNLEEAAFRMARALVSVEDRTLFTDLGTLSDLERAAREREPVLLHFAGHGLPGRLVFEDLDGGPDEVETSRLLLSLRQAMGRLPGAIWLSCSYGAGSDRRGRSGDIPTREWGRLGPQTPSIAADLHRAGVPQVLGYFGSVPDALAVEVDRSLFEELARKGSTLQAVRAARLRTQRAIVTDRGWVRFPLAWTLLGLYHRGDDVPLLSATNEPSRALANESAPERQIEALYGLEALHHGFIGRRRLLAKMRRLRHDGDNVLGLYGLGGLGKTAAMNKLSRVFAGDQAGWQGRVVALSLRKRDQSFAALREAVVEAVTHHPARPADWGERLRKVEEGSNERGVALARVLLSVLTDRVLYIDNAETLQVDPRKSAAESERVPWCDAEVASFFQTLCAKPPSSVTVLLTTRYRPQDTGGAWVPIEPCTKDEIFRMTRWFRSLRRLPPSLRAELAAHHLAGHPRAVEWADALVEDRATKWRDEGHELRRDASVEEVRAHVFEPALAGLPAKATPDLLLEALIKRLGPGPRALLSKCCAIGLPVPLEVVRRLGEGSEVLLARGLLSWFEGKGWAMHPFVREVVERAGLEPSARPGRGVLADYWLAQCHAKGGAPEIVWKEALEHLLAVGRWADAMVVVTALDESYRRRGWVRASVELFEDLAEHAWPDDERGTVLHRASAALLEVCRYAEAEQRVRESIAVQERACGTREHPDVASSLNGLGNVLERQGRYGEAEAAYREALSIQGSAGDQSERPDTSASLHGLANVLERQGRYGEAEAAYREAIGFMAGAYGARAQAPIAASLAGLGNVLNRQGRYAEAEAAYRKAIAALEAAYGAREHPDVAVTLASLADVLARQGRYGEAEAAFCEAIALQERIYSTPDHASVSSSLCGLANLLARQGRYGEAEAIYRRAIVVQERLYGTREHPEVIASMAGLADVFERQGRYGEAEVAYREVIALSERAYGTREHATVALSLNNLANVLTGQWRYVEAAATFEEALAIVERAHGTREHPDVAATLHGLASVLTAQGRHDEAAPIYREVIATLERTYGKREHLDVASALYGLANTLYGRGRYDEAEAGHREALALLERACGTRQHRKAAAFLHGLAVAQIALARFDEAERSFKEAISIETALLGSARTHAALPTLVLLAELLFERGRAAEALPYARDAWAGAIEAKNHELVIESGVLLVNVFHALGHDEEARDVVRVVATLVRQLPEGNPVRAEGERRLGLRT